MSKLLGDLPRLFPRPEQTIAGIGRLLRQGEVSCVDILMACLEQVDEWEPKVHAWVVLDRDGAIDQARSLDEELRVGKDRGPLHGMPIGIKDIIDVKGLPTACGARRWVDRLAETDAKVVSLLRRAGTVIMGKTVTTPYAWIDPPATRNPWNLDRTPGGSSSGSAAAVSCGMCYGALGTQTGGSITRPASFCGVAGMKPHKEIAADEEVYPLAPSLDHLGPLARTSRDLRILFNATQGISESAETFNLRAQRRDGPPRLARLRGFFDRRAEPAVRSSMDAAAASLVSAGAEVVDLADPVDFDQILVDHRNVMAAEAAWVHSDWLDEHPDDYPPRIRALILEGRSVPALHYIRATNGMFLTMWRIFCALTNPDFDAFITPATVSTAPDATTTGDPALNSPWSYTGMPTVSFPIGPGSDGLPVALQLIGGAVHDHDLLHTAEWCEHAIRTSRQ
jgi:Asp-tRNA(Asn)/Glu-tRNA(Gln) amidotransferase A subunit family amidase